MSIPCLQTTKVVSLLSAWCGSSRLLPFPVCTLLSTLLVGWPSLDATCQYWHPLAVLSSATLTLPVRLQWIVAVAILALGPTGFLGNSVRRWLLATSLTSTDGSFRLSLLQNALYEDSIVRLWKSWQAEKHLYDDISAWWDVGKARLRDLSRRFGRDLSASRTLTRREHQRAIVECQRQIDSSSLAALYTLEEHRRALSDLDRQELEGARVRSRLLWTEKGETSPKLFTSVHARDVAFKLLHRVLPTRSRLARWHLASSGACSVCGVPDETLEHVFDRCSLTHNVLHLVGSLFRSLSPNIPPTFTLLEAVFCRHVSRSPPLAALLWIVLVCIWTYRRDTSAHGMAGLIRYRFRERIRVAWYECRRHRQPDYEYFSSQWMPPGITVPLVSISPNRTSIVFHF